VLLNMDGEIWGYFVPTLTAYVKKSKQKHKRHQLLRDADILTPPQLN
jgi:hypothetical protein